MFNHHLYESDTQYDSVILLAEWVATIVSSILTSCLRGFHFIAFRAETGCDTAVDLLLSTLERCLNCFDIQHNHRKSTSTSAWYQQPSAMSVRIPYTSITDAQITPDIAPHMSIVIL